MLAFGGYDEVAGASTINFSRFDGQSGNWIPEEILAFAIPNVVYAMSLSNDFLSLAIKHIELEEEESEDEEFRHQHFRAIDSHAVFRYDRESNVWMELGETFSGELIGSGRTSSPQDYQILGSRIRLSNYLRESAPISISDSGMILAVGYPANKEQPKASIYKFEGDRNDWVSQRADLRNEDVSGFEGWSVALSGDANMLVVGTGGDARITQTYLLRQDSWKSFGGTLPGGEYSSVAISGDASVLAVGTKSVDVFHRSTDKTCPDNTIPFQLSLTLDTHPEDTHWDLMSNKTNEFILSGGPYVGSKLEFPYDTAYERSTVFAKHCIPRNDCTIFSLCKCEPDSSPIMSASLSPFF